MVILDKLDKYIDVFIEIYEKEYEGALPLNIKLESFVPNSARKTKQRLFVKFLLDGSAKYILKLPVSDNDNKVSREYVTLTNLQLGINVAPKPFLLYKNGFIMSYIDGELVPDLLRVTNNIHKWNFIVDKAIDAIVQLHKKDATPAFNTKEILKNFCERIGVKDYIHESIPESLKLSIGSMHGDLGPWNIVYNRKNDNISLLDWEDYQPNSIQVMDLINFLFTLPVVMYPEIKNFKELFKNVFLRNGYISELICRGLNRYAKQMNISGRDLLFLVPIYCQQMIYRLEQDNRPSNNYFYGYFKEAFSYGEIPWSSKLIKK
ncbi:aminoglycoside phosphotransferase family protein [Paenibacillus humicus]|uniref:aminoglycoside phosphotransferase family protein n=1 Tax=Paenibacillus humicus TaxID=412861 RepID=UPI003D2B09F8